MLTAFSQKKMWSRFKYIYATILPSIYHINISIIYLSIIYLSILSSSVYLIYIFIGFNLFGILELSDSELYFEIFFKFEIFLITFLQILVKVHYGFSMVFP